MVIVTLIEMLFLHVFADYNLQGILASMKRKRWWIKQAPNQHEFERSKYKNDYKAALLAHSFEWTFVILLPMLYYLMIVKTYAGYYWLCLLLITNTIVHYRIDDEKANNYSINLIQDQIMHVLQIFITWGLWTLIIGWN